MAESTLNYALFYNSENGDRVYDADSFSEWLRKFFTTGVFTGDLRVLAGDGMQVSVQAGYCNINGKVKLWQSAETLDVTTAHATYDRIDNVVIERNDTDRDFNLKVVTGSATDTPAAKNPVREDGVYQLVLAHVYVAAGATSITQADITDCRPDTDLCGIVAATVDQIDFSQIQAQFDSYMANYKKAVAADYAAYDESIEAFEAQAETLFGAWFESMRGQLSEDAAGKLQNEIDEIEDGRAPATQEKVTAFPDASTVVETWADGRHLDTIFQADGSILETLYTQAGVVVWSKTTTFEVDGSIKEEING